MTLVVKDLDRDSTIWQAITPRKTDIIIGSYSKAGTTLTQQIVNLLYNGNSDFGKYGSLPQMSPWVEEIPERFFGSLEEKIKHIEELPEPKFFKTHLPFDALPYYPEWRYIYLVRDARDVALSLYNHTQSLDPNFYTDKIEGSFAEFWENWLQTGQPLWPFWDHIISWWQARHLPNVLLIHYSDLIKDKVSQVEIIANFINVTLDEQKINLVMEQSSLEYMKENADKFQPPGFLPKSFFKNGKNGLWKEFLTDEIIARYEMTICEKLGDECNNWAKNGGTLRPLVEESSAFSGKIL